MNSIAPVMGARAAPINPDPNRDQCIDNVSLTVALSFCLFCGPRRGLPRSFELRHYRGITDLPASHITYGYSVAEL